MEIRSFCLILLNLPVTCWADNQTLSSEERIERDNRVSRTWSEILKGYDPLVRPDYSGEPLTIKVDVTVLSFGQINERDMNFAVDLLLRQRWADDRLKHDLPVAITPLFGIKSPADYLWVPDSVFVNAQQTRQHKVTVNNDKLDIYPNGTVYWLSRLTVVSSCPLDFRKYPVDVQTCAIVIASYAYSVEHVYYRWKNQEHENGCDIKSADLAQFTLVNHKTAELHEVQALGNYSILKANFTFKRRVEVSIIQIFFPTISVVCVSWISLWMQKKASSARIGLGVTTLLTLCTIWGSVNYRLPLVSYIKAVDLYFMVSFCFVLCTLVEYTLVLNLDLYILLMKNGGMEESTSKANEHDKEDITKILYTLPRTRTSSFSSWLQNSNARKKSTVTKPAQSMRRKSVVEIYNQESLIELIDTTHDGSIDAITYVTQEEERKEQVKIEMDDMNRTAKLDLVSRFIFPIGFLMFNLYFWLYFQH